MSTSVFIAVPKKVAKIQTGAFMAFIVLLVLIIVSGRILNMINRSKETCKTDDEYIKIARKWSIWSVGLSSAAAFVSLCIFIGLFFVKA